MNSHLISKIHSLDVEEKRELLGLLEELDKAQARSAKMPFCPSLKRCGLLLFMVNTTKSWLRRLRGSQTEI